MVHRDIRASELFREAEALFQDLRAPGSGQLSDGIEVDVSADGTVAAFTGTIVDQLEGVPPTRICQVDLYSGDTRVLTFGPNTDRLPKFSPDGKHIAFLSDRENAGDFRLYVLECATGAARATPSVQGWVEYLHWSPDGERILLGVAGFGADLSGGEGATSRRVREALPSWMPSIECGGEAQRWRSAAAYELATHTVRQITTEVVNVWEAVWCGNRAIAAVISRAPGEGHWYTASLALIDLQSGAVREVHAPSHQLGLPAASPSGRQLAVVEALCSDRGFTAGDLTLIEVTTGNIRRLDTNSVDVSSVQWRSEETLLVAGYRGCESVVGLCDVARNAFLEVWKSEEITGAGGIFFAVSGWGTAGDCVIVGRGFDRVPEIAVIRKGRYEVVRSLALKYTEHGRQLQATERITWQAPDGLEIQGWLLRPQGRGPYPLIMVLHGGPVSHWRPAPLSPLFLMLLKRGYALFLPNPRGSSGRGQAFARRVLGDMGGADAQDLLSGLDALLERGVADSKRLGVMGGSYGGFMTCWLITQDPRFAAAVPISPAVNHVTAHLIGNIPDFVKMFLNDKYDNAAGRYFTRSPIMHVHKARTPTLQIAGALDRCTPAEEAMQFHHALLENGVRSVLATYPEEGHGVRKFPAVIDYTARVVGWFEEHIG